MILKGSEHVCKEKSQVVGYILAFFLGGLGAHLFYYQKYLRGFLYLLFSWTYVPIVLGWIDMFFVKKWTYEINKSFESKEESTSHSKDVLHKLSTNQNIKDKGSRALEKISSFTNDLLTENQTRNSSTFYDEDDIILPEYSHLKVSDDILAHLNQKDEVYENNGVRVSISTSKTEFIKDSLKYAKESGTETKEIPFQAYWPTFRDLNERQLKWYLYWRGQVLKGNYLEVDLSYIFIFVYELLNYSFNKNAAFNVSMLVRLLDNYKEMHQGLEKYLNVWIADMLYEIGEQTLAEKWDKHSVYDIPRLYQILSDNNENLESISMSVWKPYIRNYRETVFFQNNKRKIYNKFKKSIPLIQKAYQEKGTDLLNEWFKVVDARTVRDLYNSAVVDRVDMQIHVRVKRIQPKDRIYDVLTNLFRLAENVVRIEQGEKMQIKVDETVLPENIKESMLETKQRFKTVKTKEISETGSEIPSSPKNYNIPEDEVAAENEESDTFSLDWEEIDKKEKELLQFQSRVENLGENNEEQNFIDDSVAKMGEFEKFNTDQTLSDSNRHESETIIEQSLDMIFQDTEGDDDDFIEALTNIERQFLLLFKDNVLSIDEAKTFAKEHGKMLGLFVTEINEKANEYLEDILLEENENSIEMIEDYSYLIDILRGVEVEN